MLEQLQASIKINISENCKKDVIEAYENLFRSVHVFMEVRESSIPEGGGGVRRPSESVIEKYQNARLDLLSKVVAVEIRASNSGREAVQQLKAVLLPTGDHAVQLPVVDRAALGRALDKVMLVASLEFSGKLPMACANS
ncbi:hypothetical protein [Amycolatopsis sp. WGS_07]|uniref:hypothetical protein n=1 Tax=Amycolatopsis sp. WGS_07 TaxID=3076764 RepID=UPI0038738190